MIKIPPPKLEFDENGLKNWRDFVDWASYNSVPWTHFKKMQLQNNWPTEEFNRILIAQLLIEKELMLEQLIKLTNQLPTRINEPDK